MYNSDKIIKKEVIIPLCFEKDSGGMLHSVYSLVNSDFKKKYNVHVLLSKNTEYKDKYTSIPEVKVHFFKYNWEISIINPIIYLKKSYALYLLVKKNSLAKRKNRIILCNDFASLLLSLFLLLTGEKIVFISRGGEYDTPTATFIKHIFFPLLKKIVCVSENHGAFLIEKGVEKEKIHIIHNGVESPKKVSEFNKEGQIEREIQLAVIGYISTIKNQKFAVTALKELLSIGYNVILNLYGDIGSNSDKAYFIELSAHIDELGVKNEVMFRGYTEKEIIYKNSDIVLSVSNSEGFGRTIIEAFSYGIPVIANKNTAGPSSIITNGYDGYLYNDLCDLVDKMEILINLEEIKNEIIENAKETFKDKFTIEIMVDKYIKLIDSVVM